MNALRQLTQQFSLLKLRVTIQFKQDTVLPAFKGSMLHGWFGHALKQADEHAFFVCYGEHGNQQPKPYIITPNGDHKTQWHKHELFDFEITLFGSAIELVDTLFIALKIGENMGFGNRRTPFSVVSISSILPTHQQTGIHPFTLFDAISSQIESRQDFSINHEIALQLVTPLRMKHQGDIIKKSAPPLEFILKQIERRLILLSQYWVDDNATLFEQIRQQTPCLGAFESNAHCYFEDWLRYSHKAEKNLPFGGLKGQFSFCGEVTESLPLLIIGEQLHVGGKTTFGLGKYQLIQ
ncbi:CRISPR system precrRNA processing endoribonuclease RAMP protein Cas6 [Psychromonas arctica]|uniref:CRISPR system precrRNA processing endoribonuclease RAMP protein Cas6 n=1 Tax=Psychromonas arctica TaxID=168275 RepID=UPI002FD6A1BA